MEVDQRCVRSRVLVGVLGELEVRLDGRPTYIGHAQRRSVLAALAVDAGRVVPVGCLIDRIWGDRAPQSSRAALRTYLARLRPVLALGEVTITHRDGGYLLAVTPEAVDLNRFRQLVTVARGQQAPEPALEAVAKALKLWRGKPLSELDTEWAHGLRETLCQERSAAEADRVDWALASGRHHQMLPELIARANAEPLDERIAGQLMVALCRCGRQTEALSCYRQIRSRLAREMGTDPGAALQELHQRILGEA